MLNSNLQNDCVFYQDKIKFAQRLQEENDVVRYENSTFRTVKDKLYREIDFLKENNTTQQEEITNLNKIIKQINTEPKNSEE